MTRTDSTVAVIGLGVMCAPMAANPLTVLSDTPDVDLAVSGEDGVFAHAESGARCGLRGTAGLTTARRTCSSRRCPAVGRPESPPETEERND